MLTYEFIDPEEQIASEEFQLVESFLKATGRTQIGWHYITDITWIYSKVKNWPRTLKILDAGGGLGPLQFLLAEMGFQVTNIDMVVVEPVVAYSHRYQTKSHNLPSFVPSDYKNLVAPSTPDSFKSRLKKWVKDRSLYKLWKIQKYTAVHERWRSEVGWSERPIGELQWCLGNLCHMPEIASASFDAVVSLSSLEHIPLELLDTGLAEIRRVLKPDACWAVTTSGTEQPSTWLHEPSRGYCFSVCDIEMRFGASNCKRQDPVNILDKYRQCDYLRTNLAKFYKKSGNLGMPWGKWDPKYIPLGLAN